MNTLGHAQGPDEFYGLHVGTDTKVSQSVNSFDDLGVKWVRVFANINSWKSPSSQTAFQQAIDLKAAGYKVILELNALNGIVPPDYDTARMYWEWLMARPGLKDAVDVYEILNELNLSKYWKGTPQQYVDWVLKSAWDVIHTTHGEKILAGSFTANQGTWAGTEVTEAYINAGYLSYCDYAGVHPYLENVNDTRNFIDAHIALYGSKPIIITEWNFKPGTSTTSPNTNYANNLSLVRDFMYTKPTIKTVCFYRHLYPTTEGEYSGLQWSGTGYPPYLPFYNMYKCWPMSTNSGANAPPTNLVLTSPTNGQTFTQGNNITFTLTGSDIASVKFFIDGDILVGTDASSSGGWSISSSTLPPGRYQVSAVAFDSQGARRGVYGTEIIINSSTTGKVISVNFQGLGSALASTDVAGAVARDDWNNTGYATFTRGLVDNNGANTGATIQNDVPYAYFTADGTSSGDHKMMGGYVGNTSTSSVDKVIIRDLPAAVTNGGYHVYVYWGNRSTNNVAVKYTIGTVSYYLRDNTNTWSGAHEQSTATSASAAVSGPNYVRFTGLTGSSFTLSVQALSSQGGISGIQVVNSSISPTYGTVKLSQPTNGQTFAEGSNITFKAITKNFSGTISSVKFYYNTNQLIGQGVNSNDSVWTFTTNSLPPGNHSINAVASVSGAGNASSQAATIAVTSALASKTINISFKGSGPELSSTDVAGVVPVANWNNTYNDTTNVNLKRGNGNSTTVSIANTLPSNYNSNDGTGNGDYKMMKGYVGWYNQTVGNVTISGLPSDFSSYDVYVYWGNRGGAVDGSVAYTLDGTTYYLRDNNTTWNGTHVRSTATSLSTATTGASYVLFENVSGSSFTLNVQAATGGSFRGGISGLQIVSKGATNYQLEPVADSYVQQNSSGSNYGTQASLQVKASSSYARIAYLKFNLTNVSAAGSAKLRLYGGHASLSRTIYCKSSSNTSWGETSITWSNKPAIGSTLSSTSVGTTGWYEWDVTSFVQANLGNTITLVVQSSSSAEASFNSREGANSPELFIDNTTSGRLSTQSEDTQFNIEITDDVVNYPNPFDTETKIHFSFKEDSWADVEVFDVAGRKVLSTPSKYFEGLQPHEIIIHGARLEPGVYTFSFKARLAGKGVVMRRGRMIRGN